MIINLTITLLSIDLKILVSCFKKFSVIQNTICKLIFCITIKYKKPVSNEKSDDKEID